RRCRSPPSANGELGRGVPSGGHREPHKTNRITSTYLSLIDISRLMSVDLELAPKQKRGRRALLRARRLSRGSARGSTANGRGRKGPGRSNPLAARGRSAQARRIGLRLRARAIVRHLSAHALAPSEEAPQCRDRRFRAEGPVGLLLRDPWCPRGAIHVAELTEDPCCTSERQGSCCEPSEKANCCGDGCRCDAGSLDHPSRGRAKASASDDAICRPPDRRGRLARSAIIK